MQKTEILGAPTVRPADLCVGIRPDLGGLRSRRARRHAGCSAGHRASGSGSLSSSRPGCDGRRPTGVVRRDRGGLEIARIVRGRKIVVGVDQACRRGAPRRVVGPLPGAWVMGMTGHDCQGKC